MSHPRQRLAPKVRTEQLLAAALDQAKKIGYRNVTAVTVAQAAGVAPSLVTYYFSTMTQLRRALMRAAVKREVLPVIAQGIADRNPSALAAPPEVKARAIATL